VDQRRVRGQRNRRALIDAALGLFDSQGFDATTADQIAERAGVSTRTLFHHFPDKEAILFDQQADRLESAIQVLRTTGEESLYESLAALARAVAASILDQGDVFPARARMYGRFPSLRSRMLSINETWIDKVAEEIALRYGVDVCEDPRPRIAAAIVNSSNRATIEVWLDRGCRDELTEMIMASAALLRPTVELIETSLHKVETPVTPQGRHSHVR
jgi:AcrR family transcriptional regulator